MRNYNNLVEALRLLNQEGYKVDFKNETLDLSGKTKYLVEETIHFEDLDGSAETSSNLYVIKTSQGEKGFLITADSIYKDAVAAQLESLLIIQ